MRSGDPGSLLHEGLAELPGPFSDHLPHYLSKEGAFPGSMNYIIGTGGKRELKKHISTVSTPKTTKSTFSCLLPLPAASVGPRGFRFASGGAQRAKVEADLHLP